MAEAQAVFGIEHITHSDLPQIMAALLVVTALREPVALVRAGHPGIEVGRVVGQQPPADELLLFPDADQPRSEEHTSELQSQPNLVCRLLLEKKNKLGSDQTRAALD